MRAMPRVTKLLASRPDASITASHYLTMTTPSLSHTVPETERAVSEARLCAACGVTLANRRPQARFCSARCRTAARRENERRRLNELLDTMQQILDTLRRGLLDHP